MKKSPILLLLKIGTEEESGSRRYSYQKLFLEFHKFTRKIVFTRSAISAESAACTKRELPFRLFFLGKFTN